MKLEPKETVLSFLGSRNDIPGATEEEKLSCAYLDVGVLDSFGIIEMVSQRFSGRTAK